MISKIKKSIISLDIHSLEVIKKSSSSMLVKIIGLLAGLAVSVFLGRSIGAEGLGIISLSNKIVDVAMVFALLGLRQVIVKEVSIGFNKGDLQHIGNVLHTTYILNGLASLAVSVTLILLTPWLVENVFNEPMLKWPLIIAIIVMPMQIFSRLFAAGINGYRKIWQSNLVDQTLSSLITGIVLFIIYLAQQKITIIDAAIAYAGGRACVTITTGLYWKRLFRFKHKKQFIGRGLLKTAMPLLLFSASILIATNADAIMIGWLSNSKEVGLYTVSARLATLNLFLLNISNSAIAPKIAALYHEKKSNEIEKMIQTVTKLLTFFALLSVIIFFFFGKNILSIWGKEFTPAYWILIILSLGQFINVATGAAGMTLIMAGEERLQGIITFSFVIFNLFSNYFLILYFQAVGAAIATAITIAGENIVKVYFVKKKLNVLTIPYKFSR